MISKATASPGKKHGVLTHIEFEGCVLYSEVILMTFQRESPPAAPLRPAVNIFSSNTLSKWLLFTGTSQRTCLEDSGTFIELA